MRALCTTALLAAGLVVLAVPSTGMSAVRVARVEVDGQSRSYRLFSPDGVARPSRAVVVLHGGGSDPEEMAALTGLDAVGQRQGWVVAYPEGIAGHWNAGGCCAATDQDDVAFFDTLRARLQRGVARRRVDVVGFSEGGFMAFRLACRRTRWLSSVVVVASTMFHRPCEPPRDLRVAAIWDERDWRVPLAGRRFGDLRFRSAAALSRFWRRANGCRSVYRRAGPGVRTEVAGDCSGRGGYTAHVLLGLGHGWPRAADRPGGIDATELVATAVEARR
jgi:polyhydroxybutyrate depolymerase